MKDKDLFKKKKVKYYEEKQNKTVRGKMIHNNKDKKSILKMAKREK